MSLFKYVFMIILALGLVKNASAQDSLSTPNLNSSLLHKVIVGEGALTISSLTVLHHLWYKNYPRSSFRFVNDNQEWLQMDKLGHATTTYYLGKIGYELLRWPGVPKKKALIYGATAGLIYMTTVEMFDGFSKEWGASFGDMCANVFGTTAFIAQELMWNEQRIQLKWSFHNSVYTQYRPDLLGRNLSERLLKDYNGQTYWLSVNMHSFLLKNSTFPKWLNVALGYSGDGMLGGDANPSAFNGEMLPKFNRKRQYFLSLDVDLSKVPTNSQVLRYLFDVLGLVKFPSPAIEYSGNSIRLHGFYF